MDNNIIQQRIATVRNIDASPENRTYEFVISTEAPDSYGTVFRADGWDVTRYMDNPVVCWNHRSSSGDPDDFIGTSEVYRDGNDLVGKVTLEIGNKKADRIKTKLDNGTIRGASIGAIIHEGRYGNADNGEDPDILYFTRQELVEWSIVGTPSNPEAIKRNKEGIVNAFAKAESTPQKRNSDVLDEYTAAYMFNRNNQ